MCAPGLSSVRPVHVDDDGNSMFKCVLDSSGWSWFRLFTSVLCGLGFGSYVVAARENTLVSALMELWLGVYQASRMMNQKQAIKTNNNQKVKTFTKRQQSKQERGVLMTTLIESFSCFSSVWQIVAALGVLVVLFLMWRHTGQVVVEEILCIPDMGLQLTSRSRSCGSVSDEFIAAENIRSIIIHEGFERFGSAGSGCCWCSCAVPENGE